MPFICHVLFKIQCFIKPHSVCLWPKPGSKPDDEEAQKHNIVWKQGDLLKYFNFVGVDEAVIKIFMVTTSQVFVECTCSRRCNICAIQFKQVQLLVSLRDLNLGCPSLCSVNPSRHQQQSGTSEGPWSSRAQLSMCCSCAKAKLQLHHFSLFVQQYFQGSSSFFFSLFSFC